jgi:carboxymethylenebutenolidase
MIERQLNVPTASGTMEMFAVHPSEDDPFPAVVIFMDIWGLREELCDIARRVATVGYYCMVPDFYYRQGKIRNEFRDDKSRMITLDRLDKQSQEKVLAPLRNLTDAMVMDDTQALLAFIDKNQPVKRGAIGSIGYCMGGRHVFRAAEHFPDRFQASASLHGTELVTDSKDSPHLAKTITGELYCGFGENDRHTPVTTIGAIDRAMRGRDVRYRREIHKNAEHGYALPDRDVFDKSAANRDWELIFAMFQRRIPRHS